MLQVEPNITLVEPQVSGCHWLALRRYVLREQRHSKMTLMDTEEWKWDVKSTGFIQPLRSGGGAYNTAPYVVYAVSLPSGCMQCHCIWTFTVLWKFVCSQLSLWRGELSHTATQHPFPSVVRQGLTMSLREPLFSGPSLPSPPTAGIKNMDHHPWFLFFERPFKGIEKCSYNLYSLLFSLTFADLLTLPWNPEFHLH